MKKLLALILSVFFVNALFSAPVVTAGITFNEFETAFNNDKVWYAQLQAGSDGTTGGNIHEFEFGGSSGTFDSNDPYYKGDFGEGVKWDQTPDTNSFVISVDSANNLSVSAVGVSTPNEQGNDWEYPITGTFNEIWVGLRLATGDDLDTISVNSHQYDGKTINDMSLTGILDGPVQFAAFKFYDDQETGNIAEFTIDGSLSLSSTASQRQGEEWTYTIFAVNNTAIPEPSAYTTLFGIIALVAVFLRRK